MSECDGLDQCDPVYEVKRYDWLGKPTVTLNGQVTHSHLLQRVHILGFLQPHLDQTCML